MEYFISPFSLFAFVILSSMAINSILQSKVPKKTYMLINSIATLPLIPVFWLMTSTFSSTMNRFYLFYLPLFMTVFIILSLLFRIFLYKKN